MRATVTNQGPTPVTLPGYVDLAAGKATTLAGLNVFQAAVMLGFASRLVIVEFTADPADLPILSAVADTPANPGGGAKTLAGIGVTLEDRTTFAAITFAEPTGLAVFDDAACTIPSATATLSTVTAGTVQVGNGTNAVLATTNTSGLLTMSVTIPGSVSVPKNVWIKSFQNPNAQRLLDASASVHEVSFT